MGLVPDGVTGRIPLKLRDVNHLVMLGARAFRREVMEKGMVLHSRHVGEPLFCRFHALLNSELMQAIQLLQRGSEQQIHRTAPRTVASTITSHPAAPFVGFSTCLVNTC